MKKFLIILTSICYILSSQAMEPTAEEIRYGVVPTTETTECDVFFEKRARDFLTTFESYLDGQNLSQFQRSLTTVIELCHDSLHEATDKEARPYNWSGLTFTKKKLVPADKLNHLLNNPQDFILTFRSYDRECLNLKTDLRYCLVNDATILLRARFRGWALANDKYWKDKLGLNDGDDYSEKPEHDNFEFHKRCVANLLVFAEKLLAILGTLSRSPKL